MGYMKDIFGAACLGVAYRSLYGLASPARVSRTTRTEDSETTREYRENSMVGGGVRAGLAAMLLKGAHWGLSETVGEAARRYGDDFVDYVHRVRRDSDAEEVVEEEVRSEEPISEVIEEASEEPVKGVREETYDGANDADYEPVSSETLSERVRQRNKRIRGSMNDLLGGK